MALAVGFISDILGKTSNQTATNEAVEAAEQAKADLAEELERKTKLQTLLETAESNARNSKRLNEELTAQNAAMKTELVNAKAKRLVPIPANDHSASRQSAKERETERFNSPSKTFDEAMLKLRDLSNILLKEEPEKTANVMKTLSPEYSWTGVMVERIRDGEHLSIPMPSLTKW
ncbi:MAG: hypothetical protein U0798_17605 [Gemmataceae bacterium]